MGSDRWALPISPTHQPLLFADISGDSYIPGTGPLSQFIRQLRGQKKNNFLSFLLLKNNEPKLTLCSRNTLWSGEVCCSAVLPLNLLRGVHSPEAKLVDCVSLSQSLSPDSGFN